MKKIFLFSLLAAFFTFTFTVEAQAQRGKKKSSKTDDYFDDSGAWTQNLWYGAGGVLGYQGSANFSVFSIGISPMVGYKLTPWLSAGPRFSVVYTGYRGGSIDVDRTGNPVQGSAQAGPFKVSSTAFGVGAFARAKFLQSFFVQAEIENYTANLPVGQGVFFYRDVDTLEFLKFKENRLNGYFGAGYNSAGGGLFGYEILVLYNFLLPDDSFETPLEIRAGLTYNF